MIVIKNMPKTFKELKTFFPNVKEQEIVEWMTTHRKMYQFDNMKQLKFEVLFRLQTVAAAIELLKSRAKFATFEQSYCNERFWNLNNKGAFLLKSDVQPADGIRDIFLNGSKYAFECATAIVIVFYKAALDSIGDEPFNYLFQDLVLYDWHYDKDLGIHTTSGNDFVPGDCLYFKNPDFNPETPQWRGENTIFLGNNLHYGHGIGIRQAEGIIEALNRQRKEQANESAYLLNQVTRPNYKYLSGYQRTSQQRGEASIRARVGQSFYTF